MKKPILLISVLFLAATGARADGNKFYWTGGSGNWSDTANWQGGAVPGTLDSAYFPHTSSITVNVDVAGVYLRTLSSTGSGTAKLTFTGKLIQLKAQVMTYFTAPVDFYAPIDVVRDTSYSSQYFQSSKAVSFYAPLSVASTIPTMLLTNLGAGSGGGPFCFYSSVTCPQTFEGWSYFKIMAGADFDVNWLKCCSQYCEQNTVVYQSGLNGVKYLGSGWSTTYIYAKDAFPKSVIRPWRSGQYNNVARFCLVEDQTFDRIDGLVNYNHVSSDVAMRIQSEKSGMTLTLNGTGNAVTEYRLDGDMNLVWNPSGDYTQTFSNRAHTISRSIAVNRGTLRFNGVATLKKLPKITIADGASFVDASTAASSLTALKTLTLGDNATFAIAASAATTPIAGLTTATLGWNSRLEIPSGCSIPVTTLQVAGTLPATGTYTGVGGASGATEVSWITGAGTVVVANSNATSWKDPVSGSWDDATKWTAGVPIAGGTALVGAQGANYTVTVSSSSTWAKSTTLDGPNATVRVPEGVEFVYNGASVTSAAKISNGARLFVDGGFCSFTNFYGTFVLSGSGALTSAVEVASGQFLYRLKTAGDANSRLQVKSCSEVRLKGGHIRDLKNLYSWGRGIAGIRFEGGRLLATGGTYHQGELTDSNYPFTENEIDFSNDSVFVSGGDSSNFGLVPAAGKTVTVTFRDKARKDSTGSLLMGGTSGGKSVLTLASSATHVACAYNTIVGNHRGEAILNVSDGYLPISARGLCVGASRSTASVGDAKGTLNLSGGRLSYLESNIVGWGDTGYPLGVDVGYGGYTPACTGRPYEGEMNISGGAFTNAYGATVIGAGYAKGTWRQTGGSYANLYSGTWQYSNFGRGFVGCFGGEGLFEMSGGVFDFRSRFYVAGGTTADLVNGTAYATHGLPVNSHDAVGKLTFSGGTMTLRENLVIGSNGNGTLERCGTGGSIYVAGTLAFSAQLLDEGLMTETQTEATLSAVLGADGIAPVQAAKATFTDSSTVAVDFTAYAGNKRRFHLVDTTNLSIDLTKIKTSFTDTSGRKLHQGARLITAKDGLYVALASKGLVLFVYTSEE